MCGARKRHLQLAFATYDTLNNVVQEKVAGIRVVKSFNREEHDGKFVRISQRIYEDFASRRASHRTQHAAHAGLHVRM